MVPPVLPDGAERPGAIGAQPRIVDVRGGAGQDRGPRRGHPGRGRVHDIRHDAGDVVRPAAVQRELDELPGDCLGVFDGGQRLAQRLVADHPGQPVRAEQVPVPGLAVVHGQVGLGHRPAVQRPQQERALGVGGDVVGADPALVDQRLHQGVVVGDLVELALPEQVTARVADMAHRGVPVRPEQRGQRGAHALDRRVGDDHLLQPGVGRGDRRGQLGQHVAAGRLGVEFRHRGDGQRAGHLARGMSAHPVRDREQARSRIRRILVPLTEEADVGTYRVAEYKCHLRSSRTVLPMRIGTPSGTGIGRVTFCRSR